MGDIVEEFKKAETIVIKVGTSTITHNNGTINFYVVEKLVRVLSDLKNENKNVVLVTSGAIGVGCSRMRLNKKPDSLPEKQALAAIGQVNLMHVYSKLLNEYGQIASQVLLTKDVIEDEQRKINAVNTFNTLFRYGSIPIVNENDTVATEEIEFGDNDTLSAIVAVLINADLLILLSDIDGLYDKNPKHYPDAKLIPVVRCITNEIEKISQNTDNSFGTGGMITKLAAARICNSHGIPMVIANGDNPYNICRIIDGEPVGTVFVPNGEED
ncbi:MAG: glutamate 5-kinase [Clostridiales bacterium]|jgi:glutamate 5-kinase|nr:glutamate 5-kinase [Clostridiales bacterium]